jgi:NAD(P)-dependent dehydrogenase (short-subunit alcohol dehydrogenase family)
MARLAGKAAIITGGEGSIGMATALASDDSSFMTGATLAADGGMSS